MPASPWFAPPSLSTDELAAIASGLFGVEGRLTPLRGERDQNTRIDTPNGSFVLKIAGTNERPEAIDFQCRALEHIACTDPFLAVPRVIRSLQGTLVETHHVDAEPVQVRLLTYLAGDTFDGVGPLSPDGLRGVGTVQGRLAAALESFEHDASSTFMPWALDSGTLRNDDLWSGLLEDSRRLVGPLRERIDRAVAAMERLPQQVIHNDAHCGNLLRNVSIDAERVVGVIDFGDLVRSARVADLAVSGAGFAAGHHDPAGCLVDIATGYHAIHPLTSDELQWLPELVLCRSAMSVLMTDFQMHHSPHIAAEVVAERPGHHAMLGAWSALDADAIVACLSGALQPEHR